MASSCSVCECRPSRPECDLVITGAITKALAHTGWIPVLGNTPTRRGETRSINELIQCLLSIKFLPYFRHESCLSTFRAKWDEQLAPAIEAVPRVYSDVHLAHFGRVTLTSNTHPLAVSSIKKQSISISPYLLPQITRANLSNLSF